MDVIDGRLIAKSQRVVLIDAVIESRAKHISSLRFTRDGIKRSNPERCRIDHITIRDQSIVEKIGAPRCQERRPFVERTSDLTTIFRAEEWRLLGGVGVPRIPGRTSGVLEEITAPLVCSRLCKDLDAAEAQLIVLRGKWMVV